MIIALPLQRQQQPPLVVNFAIDGALSLWGRDRLRMRQVKLLGNDELLRLNGLLPRALYPEGSWEWFKTLASTTLADGETMVFAAAFDEAGGMRAALPLVRALDGSLRSLTAPYTTRYTPALPDPYWSEYLGQQAATYVASSMRLEALDLEDPAISAYLIGLDRSGLARATFEHFANWYETITDFSSYWDARPARLRATVRRKLNSACKDHNATFQLFTDSADLETSIQEYLRVYASSWKEPEPYPDFIPSLARELGGLGTLRLGTLCLDGTVAAAQIWLAQGSSLTIFKLAHREEFAFLSPGTLLTHWILQSLCSGGSSWEIDFGRGDDAYKQDWLKNRRLRYGAVAANWRSRQGLTALLSQVYPTRLASFSKRFRFVPERHSH